MRCLINVNIRTFGWSEFSFVTDTGTIWERAVIRRDELLIGLCLW